MRTLFLVALAGLVAQLVDGAIGMGFGVTSSTFLLLAGLGPAQASAVVHASELGTTLVSGLSHWRFGNVDWKVVLRLGVPGGIAAFTGATVLSRLSTEAAAPVMAVILVAVGANLVWRFSRGRTRREIRGKTYSGWFLAGLGTVGGFIDATGGGGWGPISTSTLLSLGRQQPRRIVGTVNTAEFLVTLGATAGFTVGLWPDLVEHAAEVVALLIGGAIAAPVAAWMVHHLNPIALGGCVGTAIVCFNLPKLGFVPGWVVLVALTAGLALTLLGVRRARRNREEASASEALASEASASEASGESELQGGEPGDGADDVDGRRDDSLLFHHAR